MTKKSYNLTPQPYAKLKEGPEDHPRAKKDIEYLSKQCAKLEKKNQAMREALEEIKATEESESAAKEMHAIAFDVLEEINKLEAGE